MLLLLLGLLFQSDVLFVRADNTRIDRSCTVVIDSYSIADEDGNGVIHVVGNDLELEFGTTQLRGARDSVAPDELQGTGIWIRGSNVRLSGAHVSGFKVGIRATEADGLRILYGGSMKPANAHDLLGQRDVDGGLIGGASLDVDSFSAIIRAAADCAAGDSL